MNLQYIQDSDGKNSGVYIPIKEWERLKKKFKGLDKEEYVETSKEEILDGIKDALDEVKQHIEGKKKLKPAKDLLNEL